MELGDHLFRRESGRMVAALGELELRRGRQATAREHFRRALALARNPAERRFLERRVDACATRFARKQASYVPQYQDAP